MVSPIARFRGALLGLAVCDALGTAVEFQPPGSFPPVTEMTGGGAFHLEPGQWTDDTSMALCLAESLIERRAFDARDQMERYVRWWRHGHWSSTGHCFDIGTTTAAALRPSPRGLPRPRKAQLPRRRHPGPGRSPQRRHPRRSVPRRSQPIRGPSCRQPPILRRRPAPAHRRPRRHGPRCPRGPQRQSWKRRRICGPGSAVSACSASSEVFCGTSSLPG